MDSVTLQALEQEAYYAVMLVMASTPLDWVCAVILAWCTRCKGERHMHQYCFAFSYMMDRCLPGLRTWRTWLRHMAP